MLQFLLKSNKNTQPLKKKTKNGCNFEQNPPTQLMLETKNVRNEKYLRLLVNLVCFDFVIN